MAGRGSGKGGEQRIHVEALCKAVRASKLADRPIISMIGDNGK